MWILKMGALQTKSFEFLKSCISEWENGQRMNWPTFKKYTPSPIIGQPLLKSKIFWPPRKTQIPKFQLLPLNLAGTAHYELYIHSRMVLFQFRHFVFVGHFTHLFTLKLVRMWCEIKWYTWYSMLGKISGHSKYKWNFPVALVLDDLEV